MRNLSITFTVLLISTFLISSCSVVENKKVKREAELPADYNQQQSDRQAVVNEMEASKWGQAETKPYDERYRTSPDSFIYQGNVK